MDEEVNGTQNTQKNQQTNAVDRVAQTAQKGKKMVDNVKKAKKAANAAKTLSMSGPLMYILFWVFVVIVAIIIITGIVMFLVTMPGMVMEKLKAIFKEIGNYVAAFFGADTTAQIDDVQIYETLDYIEDMGWDIKSEGFLTNYYEDGDSISDKLSDAEIEAGYEIDEETGVVRAEGGKIILADSDFIFTYIMSDNYVYTLKNDNLVTQSDADTWYEKIGKGIITGWYKVRNFFAGPLLDVLGVTNQVVDGYGKGLIAIYYDNGLGKRGSIVNDGTLFNWDSVKINPETKKLSIKRVEFLNNNNAIEFSLDGWTGRYGMPLEFLLSVHKATMMPDLAFDIATSFNTNVNIYLHRIDDGEAVAAYKTPAGKYITYEEINEAKTGVAGRNVISAIVAWFDNLIEGDEETIAMADLGVDVAHNGCTECTLEDVYYYFDEAAGITYIMKKDGETYYYQEKVEETSGEETTTTVKLGDAFTGDTSLIRNKKTATKICDTCHKKSKMITSVLGDQNDYNFKAYDPYIANVSNHWYRDVYFVLNNDTKDDYSLEGDIEFVDYDYDYEAVMKERWTLYETYTDNPSDGYKYNPQKAGEFIIFQIDEDGKYKKDGSGNYLLYDGTFEEARGNTVYIKNDKGEYTMFTGVVDENVTETLYRYMGNGVYEEYTIGETIAVAKKAITIDANDTEKLEDVGWKKTDGIWTAYEKKNSESSTGWNPLFTEEELAGISNEIEKYVKENAYINLKTTGNIVQTGEGQRTQTNYEIKKMFLNNKYFRYDGSEETAEIITALRTKQTDDKSDDIKYGPLSESDYAISKYLDLDGDGNSEDKNGDGQIDEKDKYSVKDYAGTVILNQDSLNAFSMLENTHTLDSDYIYRDFKELIVELGYFEKEELTDETPRLLQFLVPGIGSAGYPNRTIDKRENEFGTMVHSKHDIDAMKKYTLVAMYKKAAEDLESGKVDEEIESGALDESNPDLNPVDGIETPNVNPINGIETPKTKSSLKIETTAEIMKNVGAMGQKFERVAESGDGYDYKVKTGSVVYTHYYQFKGSYAEKTFTWSGQTKTLHRAACGPTSCVNILTGYGQDVNPTNNIVGISFSATIAGVDEFMESYGVTGEHYSGLSDSEYVAKINEAFSQGRPIITLMHQRKTGDSFWTSGGHFVPMVGMDTNGNIITLDSGSSNSARHTYTGGVEGLMSCLTAVWIADEAPDGSATTPNPYVGYLGNEAVVSPVTGVLLEYGTYGTTPENTKDSVTELDYRVNVDLKYGPSISVAEEDPNAGGAGGANPNTPVEHEARIFSDKVGYAKILVLNKETFEIMDSKVTHKWRTNNGGNGLLSENGIFSELVTTEEELEELTGDSGDYLSETVYGFKEFAETYEKYGIAGNIIYIDGFIPELPDEEFTDSDEDGDLSDESGSPDGEDLKFKDFEITPSKIKSKEENELIQTLYEPAESYKLASEKATIKLNTEETIKADAYSAMVVDNPGTYKPLENFDKLVFIKEGTVLGRTYTDKELVEERLEAGDDPKYNFEYYAPEDSGDEEENTDRLIGNYLRIIMRDVDDTVVEDVENYMKLDEMFSNIECEFEHFAYFLGCLEEGFYEDMDLGSSYGVEVLNDGAGNTTAFGLTKAVAGLASVQSAYPSFGSNLASGSVPKEEAQDVFILTLEAAKEEIQNKLNTKLDDTDTSLFALMDLHHASPSMCYKVIDIYNGKSNNLSKEEMMSVFTEHWGSNMNYEILLKRRGRNRGWIASEGRWFLYQNGSAGDEVIFDTETPWTEFCEGGGTYDLTRESSGFYHVEKGADPDYIK